MNYKYDTLALHHCIDARLPHDLATQASLYTRFPYWKKSSKELDSVVKFTTKFEDLCAYNALDCVSEWRLAHRHLTVLEKGEGNALQC